MSDDANLTVWNRTMELAEGIYRVTANFPAAERYGLSGQLKRAAVSMVSNIAKGRGREAQKNSDGSSTSHMVHFSDRNTVAAVEETGLRRGLGF